MTTRIRGEGFTKTRLVGELMLGTRVAVAAFAGKSVRTVRTHCTHIACDTATKAHLYDIDACIAQLCKGRQ